MYMILENPKRMTKSEMRQEFANKWVFAVEGDFDIGVPLKTLPNPRNVIFLDVFVSS